MEKRLTVGDGGKELLVIEGIPRALLEEIGRKRFMTIEMQVFEAITRYLSKYRK